MKKFLQAIVLALISISSVHADTIPNGTAVYGADPNYENLEYYIAPTSKAPIIVFVHGGNWSEGDRSLTKYRNLCGLLRAAGYAVVNINYTLDVATSYTGYPMQPNELDTAMLWAKTNASLIHGDSTKMVLCGHSAGGHLVVLHVLKNTNPRLNVKGVMATSGVFDFDNLNPARLPDVYRMLGDSSYYYDAQPINHVTAIVDSKFLCINGKGDNFLMPPQSMSFNNAMQAANQCMLFHFVPGSHALLDNLTDTSLVFVLMKNFLDSISKSQICTGGSCGTPTGLIASNVTSTSATLQWNPAGGGQYYDVEYKQTNSSNIDSFTLKTFMNLNNLTPDKTYKWKVQSVCVTKSGNFSAEATFHTNPALAIIAPKNSAANQIDLSIYPNPSQGNLVLNCTLGHSENAVISIYDLLGRKVFTGQNYLDEGSTILTLNTRDFSNGIYMVEVRDQLQTVQQKFIISGK